jgi:pseudouridine-5'-monophosphatase
MNVVWVPDGELKALDPEATHGAKVVVEHLGQFKCEDWGLPAMEA